MFRVGLDGSLLEASLPIFMIERRYAEELEASAELVDPINSGD